MEILLENVSKNRLTWYGNIAGKCQQKETWCGLKQHAGKNQSQQQQTWDGTNNNNNNNNNNKRGDGERRNLNFLKFII